MGIGKGEKNGPTRGHHPTKVGPVGCPSPLKHMRHVRGDPKDPDTYSNGLPRAVKGKSDGSTCKGGESMFLKKRRGLVNKYNNLGNLSIFSD